MIVIVGLGNVGSRYAKTRHNIGFMVIDALAEHYQLSWKQEPKLKATIATFTLEHQTIVLAKPDTMMNGSGEAVQRLVQKYQPEEGKLWVVFDDVDTRFGHLRLRAGGSAGGHQGAKSIVMHIGQNFVRVKVGISLNDRAVEPSEVYVLKPFTLDEQLVLPAVIHSSTEVLVRGLVQGLTDATIHLI